MWQPLLQCISLNIPMQLNSRPLAKQWRCLTLKTTSIVLGLGVLGILQNPALALTKRGPVTLGLMINRVTATSSLDLPPLDQRPSLYATIELDGRTLTTDTNTTPQIGASIYPDWSITIVNETMWFERGHQISATVRIFDHDPDDADDKVLLTSMTFDPIACRVWIGNVLIEGDRQGRSCSNDLTDIQGVDGSANLTLTSAW